MSLAEQIQRVDGGQNDTLKAILTALGVTVGTQKIDQLAALAATISPKLKPDNLNSAETNALFGLGADAVPDQVLAKISESLSSLESSQISHAIGNFTASVTLPFTPDSVWVVTKSPIDNVASNNSLFLYPGLAFTLPSQASGVSTYENKIKWTGNKITRSGDSRGAFRYLALKFGEG